MEKLDAECGFAREIQPLLLSTASRMIQDFARATLLGQWMDERRVSWAPEVEAVDAALRRWHPVAMDGIGTTYLWWQPDALNVLRLCTFEVMRRAVRVEWLADGIGHFAEDVARSLDRLLHGNPIDVVVIAEIVGIYLPEDQASPMEIDADPEVQIELLTEEMVHELHLGPSSPMWDLPRFGRACAITARSTIPVRLGAQGNCGANTSVDLFSPAQDALLALQVAHRAAIGAPRILHRAPGAVIPPGLNVAIFGESPRFGAPALLDQESFLRCRDIYRGLRGSPHSSLRLACSRLATSRLRLRPEDAILDAAIGLESILLIAGGKGELRYQFSLNYALLHEKDADRAVRFALAQHVYDVRSIIAHGGEPSTKELGKVAPDANLHSVAKKCQDMLSECIEEFRSDMQSPLYTKPGYWRNRAIGAGGDSVGKPPL